MALVKSKNPVEMEYFIHKFFTILFLIEQLLNITSSLHDSQ